MWIEANPKETDLTYLQPGNAATVTVDSHPGVKWRGKVESISPATGAEFSLIPAQNASGNWVKVCSECRCGCGLKCQQGAAVSCGDVCCGGDRYRSHLRLRRPVAVKPGLVLTRHDTNLIQDPHRAAITACVMLATIMQALDMTIANVALLPYMQRQSGWQPWIRSLGANVLHRGIGDYDAADRMVWWRGLAASSCLSLRWLVLPLPRPCAAWRHRLIR